MYQPQIFEGSTNKGTQLQLLQVGKKYNIGRLGELVAGSLSPLPRALRRLSR
jgi:hypothetical protein